jgi:hypothetical protein
MCCACQRRLQGGCGGGGWRGEGRGKGEGLGVPSSAMAAAVAAAAAAAVPYEGGREEAYDGSASELSASGVTRRGFFGVLCGRLLRTSSGPSRAARADFIPRTPAPRGGDTSLARGGRGAP